MKKLCYSCPYYPTQHLHIEKLEGLSFKITLIRHGQTLEYSTGTPQLAKDFLSAHGEDPALIDTFVDHTRSGALGTSKLSDIFENLTPVDEFFHDCDIA